MLRTARVVGVGALVFASVASAQTITYGPILGMGGSPDTAIVKWGTASASDTTEVSFRLSGQTAYQAVSGAAAKDHEVLLTGLSSASTYQYFVKSGTTQSAVNQFVTCPTAGAPFRVAVYGASTQNPTEHAKIVAQVTASNPALVLHAGNLASPGLYNQYLFELFPVIGALAAKVPLLAVMGNEDNAGGLGSLGFGLVLPHPRQNAGDPWVPYFAMRCSNVLFVGLDSNAPSNSAQNTFLTAQLSGAAADSTLEHVIVTFHHGPYSTGPHGDQVSVQQNWVSKFAATAKVRVVFSGYDHFYERLTKVGDSTSYIVTGGGGSPLSSETTTSTATRQAFFGGHHYLLVDFNGASMTATAYDDLGVEVDRWSFPDAGTPLDAGFDGGSDAGPDDDGGALDAGSPDAGMSELDGGDVMDAGDPPDGGGATVARPASCGCAQASVTSLLALIFLPLCRLRKPPFTPSDVEGR